MTDTIPTTPRQPVVFRFYDTTLNVHQVSPFPEDNTPFQDVTPLATRTRFITVVECFSNLLYFFAKDLGEEELADQIQQTGLDWEHLSQTPTGSSTPAIRPGTSTLCYRRSSTTSSSRQRTLGHS